MEEDVPGKIFNEVTAKLKFPPATYNMDIVRGATKHLEQVPTEVSDESNMSLSTLEKAEPWDGYENDTLPPKKQTRFLRNLRHQVFSLYRRLFGIVLVVNMSIFVAILCQGRATAQRLGLIVIANISSSIFIRQDYVINAFFAVFCAVPLSYVVKSRNPTSTHVCPSRWPLRIRTICARVYHIGGCESTLTSLVMSSVYSRVLRVHSGFAISGVVWLTLFTGQATRELFHAGPVRQTSISDKLLLTINKPRPHS
jgi:hypothetical protein